MPIPQFVADFRRKVGTDLMLLPSIDAVVLNDAGEVLLHRRADTGRWSLLSGIIEPGEDPAAAVVREVFEETGVRCRPVRVTGVYSTPVITYPNGDRAQYVVTDFLCRAEPGEPRVNDDESLEVRYWPVDRVPELRDDHRHKLDYALSGRLEPYFRPTS